MKFNIYQFTFIFKKINKKSVHILEFQKFNKKIEDTLTKK